MVPLSSYSQCPIVSALCSAPAQPSRARGNRLRHSLNPDKDFGIIICNICWRKEDSGVVCQLAGMPWIVLSATPLLDAHQHHRRRRQSTSKTTQSRACPSPHRRQECRKPARASCGGVRALTPPMAASGAMALGPSHGTPCAASALSALTPPRPRTWLRCCVRWRAAASAGRRRDRERRRRRAV